MLLLHRFLSPLLLQRHGVTQRHNFAVSLQAFQVEHVVAGPISKVLLQLTNLMFELANLHVLRVARHALKFLIRDSTVGTYHSPINPHARSTVRRQLACT